MRTAMHDSASGHRQHTPPLLTESLTAGVENALLATLSPGALLLLQRHVCRRNLAEGHVLWDAGELPEQIYFPRSGMISIRVPTGNGCGVEVATIGHEGAAGFQFLSGAGTAVTQAVVQIGGQFVSIAQDVFAATAQEHEELGRLAHHCIAWLLLQAQQIAACNTAHSADARFCRWLLRASDAVADETVFATQEAIAEALGVRRTTATLIAQRLQQVRLISYSRGRIIIRDRAGLEAAACDCHAILKRRTWPSELMRTEASPVRQVT
jgi:CRP-like cAMP-binding protein